MRTFTTYVTALVGVTLVTSLQAQIAYTDFGGDVSGLQFNGDAARVGSVLRITPSAPSQSGSVFSETPIDLNDLLQFSTRFQFNISGPAGIGDGDGTGADGIVFVAQTVANTAGGMGGGIGYSGLPDSLGVEFDTYNNGAWDDNDGNHVGIDLAGDIDSVAQIGVVERFNNGEDWTAWIDYDGATLEVRANRTGVRPALPLLSYNVDLAAVLGSDIAFIGFTSGTGSGYGDHDILNWEFRSEYRPIDGRVPECGSTLLMLGMGAVTAFLARRRCVLRR